MTPFIIYAITTDNVEGVYITSNPDCTDIQAVERWLAKQPKLAFERSDYFACAVQNFPELILDP